MAWPPTLYGRAPQSRPLPSATCSAVTKQCAAHDIPASWPTRPTRSSRVQVKSAPGTSSSTTRCWQRRGSPTSRLTGESRASCKRTSSWIELMEVPELSIAQSTELRGGRGRIVVHRWSSLTPRFVALVAHGYGEHAGRYAHVADRLVAEGADVYAPDFEGHGRSEGERARFETVDDLADELASVYEAGRRAHAGKPVVLIGHSLGGLIATRFVQ